MDLLAREQRVQTACLFILTSIAIAAALSLFSAVLIPFVLAIFLNYCLSPLIDLQVRRLRIPHAVAILVTILLGCAVLFIAGVIVSVSVTEVANNADQYRMQIEKMLHSLTESAHLEWLGDRAQQLSGSLLKTLSDTAKRIFSGTVSGIMSVLSNGMLVVIFMIFMLAGKRVEKTNPDSIGSKIQSQIKRYTFTMPLTSAVTGAMVGLTLFVLGVDFALMFGFLAFLLNFIPNIGSVIATLLPIPVVILSPGLSMPARIMAIAIPAVVQFVVGNLLQPKLMGRSLNLHPVTILLALIFFGAIWGIVGMFLATPIMAVLKILLEKFDYTRGIAELLAGRFARARTAQVDSW